MTLYISRSIYEMLLVRLGTDEAAKAWLEENDTAVASEKLDTAEFDFARRLREMPAPTCMPEAPKPRVAQWKRERQGRGRR